jgi:hypothetical protein
MWSHIFKFVGLQGTHVWARIAPEPIRFSEENIDRKLAAVEAREAVVALIPDDLDAAVAEEAESAMIMHQK